MTALRQRMIEDMQIRKLTPHTQRAYLQYVTLFADHFRKSPEKLGPAEIRSFQLYLAQERMVVASSIGVAVAALRFLLSRDCLAGLGAERDSGGILREAAAPGLTNAAGKTARHCVRRIMQGPNVFETV